MYELPRGVKAPSSIGEARRRIVELTAEIDEDTKRLGERGTRSDGEKLGARRKSNRRERGHLQQWVREQEAAAKAKLLGGINVGAMLHLAAKYHGRLIKVLIAAERLLHAESDAEGDEAYDELERVAGEARELIGRAPHALEDPPRTAEPLPGDSEAGA